LLPRKLCIRIGFPSAVPNTNNPLPIECPKCHHTGSMLIVQSFTVVMVKCDGCRHTWVAAVDSLPAEIQERVHAVLQEQ
jgi:hypothetical protein